MHVYVRRAGGRRMGHYRLLLARNADAAANCGAMRCGVRGVDCQAADITLSPRDAANIVGLVRRLHGVSPAATILMGCHMQREVGR